MDLEWFRSEAVRTGKGSYLRQYASGTVQIEETRAVYICPALPQKVLLAALLHKGAGILAFTRS